MCLYDLTSQTSIETICERVCDSLSCTKNCCLPRAKVLSKSVLLQIDAKKITEEPSPCLLIVSVFFFFN